MSEFNELVKAFLFGNNLNVEQSDKDRNVLTLPNINKGKGLMPNVFNRLYTRKDILKIYLIDSSGSQEEQLTLPPDDMDIVIWNDSFSGNDLEAQIKKKIKENRKIEEEKNKNRPKQRINMEAPLDTIDERYLGMGRDILFSKFYGKEEREDKLLGSGLLSISPNAGNQPVLPPDVPGKKRFALIVEESQNTSYLRNEFNRFFESFCKEQGVTAQSLPVYFSSLDFWFGGLLHTQLTNRLNMDLGLFLTDDSVFYMVKLGYIIPFIDELDLYSTDNYLNPQSPRISHLFHLCGERGAFAASCSRDSVFHYDVWEGRPTGELGVRSKKEWSKTIAKPMGNRILEDEENARLVIPSPDEDFLEAERLVEAHEKEILQWLAEPDFPILKTADRKSLLKRVAEKWLIKGACFIDIDEFHIILFEHNLLPTGKRTLADIHQIVRGMMDSGILMLSDFNHMIPDSRLMGNAIILWMLRENYEREKTSLVTWLSRHGLTQRILHRLIESFAGDQSRDILTPLTGKVIDILNADNNDPEVIKNALELYIALCNRTPDHEYRGHPVRSQRLADLAMSHKIVKDMEFESADMHNILFQQSTFIQCTFKECDLTSAYFAGSAFLKCRFIQSDLRNADFSGSYFYDCRLRGNKYDDLVLLGSLLEKCDKENDLPEHADAEEQKLTIWIDGSKGISRQTEKYDLPVLIHLLQSKYKYYTNFGFQITPDVGFRHPGLKLHPVEDKLFLERCSYYDVYDQVNREAELFFVKSDSVYRVTGRGNSRYSIQGHPNVLIDHVIKYKETTEHGNDTIKTKVLFHTPENTYIKENFTSSNWFEHCYKISGLFIGRSTTCSFLSPTRILAATDVGGLFLLEKDDRDWFVLGSKFHSEPANHIFPDSFESMAFVRRGAAVIEIWDTLNNLSLWGRLVTSFSRIFSIRLISNLNHIIVYGEWIDKSIGAMLYNIINKHLVTYWIIEDASSLGSLETGFLEEQYRAITRQNLEHMAKKSIRQVSLEEGFIRRNCRELGRILDAFEIRFPENLTYREGEPVEYLWHLSSTDPENVPADKVYLDIDIDTDKRVNIDFEIQVGTLLNVKSGNLPINRTQRECQVTWKDHALELPGENAWGDHKLLFKISLLGEERSFEGTFRIRPKNPFHGGKPISQKLNNDYMFVGRKQELENAWKRIESCHSFSIKGARRIGKTSFIHRLQELMPGNVLTAYISFDEFEQSGSSSSYLHEKLNDLRERFPDVYQKVWGDTEESTGQPGLNFKWLIYRGIERLMENYPILLKNIRSQLLNMIREGEDGVLVYHELRDFLNNFDAPPKVVFIIDEIGTATKLNVSLTALFNPFRTLIETEDTMVVLAGIPYNFHELTTMTEIRYDSGFISYASETITLGPLNADECRELILNNLSSRIQIPDDVLELAFRLSVLRPEDLQIIMKHTLDTIDAHVQKKIVTIQREHIFRGFQDLVRQRSCTCLEVWEKLTETGKQYLSRQNRQFHIKRNNNHLSLDDLRKDDTTVFKDYGFTDADGKQLIIPKYFQEWMSRENSHQN